MNRLIIIFCLISISLGAGKNTKPRKNVKNKDSADDSKEYYSESEDEGSSEEYITVETCGVQITDIRNAPYQASVEFLGIPLCGGILIGEYYVLTTAHCVLGFETELEVRVGSAFWGAGGFLFTPFDVVVHPQFNDYTRDYDISVIKLPGPVLVNDRVKPIRISPHEPKFNTYINKSGWEDNCGSFDDYSTRLLSNNLMIISRDECQNFFPDYGILISEQFFCGSSENAMTCVGKSGGAAILNNELVGISSLKLSCRSTNFPEVFINIGYLDIRNFILQETASQAWYRSKHFN